MSENFRNHAVIDAIVVYIIESFNKMYCIPDRVFHPFVENILIIAMFIAKNRCMQLTICKNWIYLFKRNSSMINDTVLHLSFTLSLILNSWCISTFSIFRQFCLLKKNPVEPLNQPYAHHRTFLFYSRFYYMYNAHT